MTRHILALVLCNFLLPATTVGFTNDICVARSECDLIVRQSQRLSHVEEDGSDIGADMTILSRRKAFQTTTAALVSAGTVLSSPSPSVGAPQQQQHVSASPTLQSPSHTIAATSASLEESISGFVAGATMAATKTVVKYPLDTATVRLQIPSQQYTLGELFQGSLHGVTTPLVANIPGAAVFFAVRDASKAQLALTELPPWMQTALAVAAAQMPYWAVRNPSEVVKTRQQAKLPGYNKGSSMVEGYQQVWQDAVEQQPAKNNHPPSRLSTFRDAFYLGYWENILYAYPADVIKFLIYDTWTRRLGGKANLTPSQGALAGAVSTAVAQLCTTPLDVVRNRLMANETTTTTTTYGEALRHLAETEGLPGLFAGSLPRVGKAVVSGAIQFATYEQTKQDIARWLRHGKSS